MAEIQQYDIALSFAGEDRDYVDRVANLLKESGIRVFYDLFEEVDLWGKDLYAHLSEIYKNRARFTVIFISEAYARKLWTKHERRAAQARAFEEAQEYILPVRFDDTDIPGVLPTVGYISLRGRSPEDLTSAIIKKLVSSGGSVPTELVRRDSSILAQSKELEGGQFSVVVKDDEGAPIAGCHVTLQANNGTTKSVSSNKDGEALLELNVRRLSTLLVSHPFFPAVVHELVDPNGSIEITLPRIDDLGSVTVHSTGFIDGLKGRLNPILDTSNRTYLYADNIAINGGENQPTSFKLNTPITLEDADGTVVYATVKHIAARVSLIEYRRKPVP